MSFVEGLRAEHVISGQRIVEAQRARIERLRVGGYAVGSHERLLATFEATLAVARARIAPAN